MRWLTAIWGLAAAGVAAGAVGPSFGQDPSRDSSAWTLQRVRQEFEAGRKRLQSVYLEATAHGRPNIDPQERVRLTLAAKGSNRYVDLAHASSGFDWEDDREWTQCYLSPEIMHTLWCLDRYCKRSRLMVWWPAAETLRSEFFFEVTGWWPPEDSTPPHRLPQWALHVILQDKDCRLRGVGEVIDGHRCAVVELPDRDTVWLDLDRGCSVVRRERNLGNATFAVYRNSRFREMAPGIWLPWENYRLIHRGPAPGRLDDENALVTELTRTTTRMEVNSVADDVFVFKPAPGTLMFDVEEVRFWQVPGGQDVLDGLVRVGRKIVTPADREDRPWARIPGPLGLLFGVGLPWVLLAWQGWKRRHGPKESGTS